MIVYTWSRIRGFPLVRLFLCFPVVLGTLFVSCNMNSQEMPASPEKSIAKEVSEEPNTLLGTSRISTAKDHIVGSGDTFAGILSKHDLSAAYAHHIYRLFKKIGFVSLFPGDSIVLTISEEGALENLSLLSRFKQWYSIRFDGPMMEAQRTDVAMTSCIRLARGQLETSLSEALYDMGIGDAVGSRFTDVFAWDINFFIDPRPGDSFTILFEENFANGKHLGYGEILAARYTTKERDFFAVGMPDTSNKLLYYDLDGNSVQKFFLKAPLKFSRISSGFSYRRRHPILGIARPHLGIDYAAPTGTPVYAAADGIVSFAGTKGGYGRHIRIRHGGAYQTYYGHLHGIARGIRSGRRVRQGDIIGTVGSTGLSTGPHLDYRMKKGSIFVNPLTIKIPAGQAVAEIDRPRYEAIRAEYMSILSGRFGANSGAFTVEVCLPQEPVPIKTKEKNPSYVHAEGS